MNIKGILSGIGYTGAPPITTNTGWRIADINDQNQIHNATIGDMIIDSPNIGPNSTYPNGAIDIRVSFSNLISSYNGGVDLAPGKKILIKGGIYDYIRMEMPDITGTALNPIILTNYGGQVRSKSYGFSGAIYWKWTGRYNYANKTGDSQYQGHAVSYRNTRDRYGFLCDKEWTDKTSIHVGIGGTATVRMANNFEIEYIECRDGGGTLFNIKEDNPDTFEDMEFSLHDIYGHDHCEEPIYLGYNINSTNQHTLRNVKVYNNRFVRSGCEFQASNVGAGCDFYNNYIFTDLSWTDPFQRFQDRAVQLNTRFGPVYFRNNIVHSAGEYFITLSNASGSGGTPDTPIAGNDIEINNNLFYTSKNLGGYIGPANDGITGYKINNNWFYDLTFGYNLVYPSATDQNTIWDIANTVIPIQVQNNRYQTGKAFIRNGASNPNVSVSGNTSTPSIATLKFVQSGYPSDFNFSKLKRWTATIGTSSGFPASGTNKGQPLVFNTGDWCVYKSLHYRSKIDNNAGNEPQGVSDAAWEIQYFDQSPYPSDDFRLESDDPFNYLGIGLLDNITPVAPSIVINTPNAVARMSTIGGFKSELSLVAEEQGDNQILLKFGKPWAKLSNGLRVGALGSSTLFGTGATTGFKLHERLAAQVATIPNGEFLYNAVNGTYSDYYVPDGSSALSDWNRNVDALLCLNLDILIVSLPSNDISFNTNAQFLANLKLIFNKAKSKGVPCFITTTQPRDGFTVAEQQRLYDFVTLIKNDPDVGPFVVDVFTPLAQAYTAGAPAKYIPAYYAGDGIHANNAGHGVIFDAIWAKISAYLTNDYISYQLQSSSSENGVYTDINISIPGNFNEYTVDRNGNQTIWYRIRGLRIDSTYTMYSIPISFEQPIYSGSISQVLNVNFTSSLNANNVPGWNKFLPSGDIPNVGEVLENLVDNTGTITPIDVTIINSFQNIDDAGGSAGVFPLDVIRSFWFWGANSTDEFKKPKISISGLDDSYLYNLKFLFSRQGGAPNRYVGAVVNNTHRSGIATPTNNSNTCDILSLKPSGGILTVLFKALPSSGFGYLNAMIIEKNNNINSVILTPPNAVAEVSNIIITPSDTSEQTIKINFTGSVLSGLPDWNDIVPVSNTLYPNLEDDLGFTTSVGVKVTSVETSTNDNGSGYVSSSDFPAAVVRYSRLKSGTPYMIITLSGLNINKLYDIKLLASRKTNSTVQGFTINGNLQTVNVSDNITPVIFTDISPNGSSEIVINLSYISGGPGFYQYIGAMIVTAKPVAAGPITISPSNSIARVSTINIPSAPGNLVIGPLNSIARASIITVQQDLSPATITTNHNYINPASTTHRMWIFQPEGYLNNSDDYALIISLTGSGQVGSGSTVANVDDTYIPQMIAAGDRPDNRYIICAPHAAGIASWGNAVSYGGQTQMYPKWAYDYMIANYRININRVYITGLSLGGRGCSLFADAYPELVAAMIPASGSQENAGTGANQMDYSRILDIAVWSHHGSTDGTQASQNTPRYGQYMNPLNPRYAPLMSIYYNLGHSSSVWNDKVARRKSSTLSGNKASFDYDKWFWKFSKDTVETAYGHMEWAENTLNIEDYWLAKRLIDVLPPGDDQDDLLDRLSDNLDIILLNKRMFLLDLGDSGNTSPSPVNNATSNTNGATTSNLLDILGNLSSYNFVVVNTLSTFTPQKVFSDRMTGEYRGLPKSFSKDCFYVSPTITNGRVKFTGLNNSRTYSVYVYGCQDLGDTMNQNYSLRITIGATVVNQYILFNTTQRIEINSITPTSGEIIIDVSSPNANTYVGVSGILLIENL